MPTYQYRCTSCGNELEAVQKFSDPALTECPQCEGSLRKIYNAVGVVFKGSGFYRTDSRAASKAPGDANGAAAPAASGQGEGASADSSGKDATSTPAAAAGKEKSSGNGSAASTKTSVGASAGSS